MALSLLQTKPTLTLSATVEGGPRTIFVTRQQAAQLDIEALIACLGYFTSSRPAVLALCGGVASPTFKAHPDELKKRFQVTDEELDTDLVDFRLVRPTEHFIAVFDPNRLKSAVVSIQMLQRFGVPVDILYVAAPAETRSGFVEHCQAAGLHLTIAEQYSALSEPKDGRIYFPAIPSKLQGSFQKGEQPFGDLLQQASPAVYAGYEIAASQFKADFEETANGRA